MPERRVAASLDGAGPHANKRIEHASFLLSAGVSTCLLSVLLGPLVFGDASTPALWGNGKPLLVLGLLAVLSAALVVKHQWRSLSMAPSGAVVALALLFLSDWITRHYSLIPGAWARGEILLLGALFVSVYSARRTWILAVVAIACIVMAISAFLAISQGMPILGDDHAVFLYRITLLRERFPWIPFYNPLWNGGIDARDFFATGVLNVFLIFSPLLSFLEPERAYNYIVLSVLFGVLPTSAWYASARFGLARSTRAIGVILAFSCSLLWYRWALKYGTMGFVCTAALIPFNLALARTLLSEDREFSPREAALFVISSTLMLFWSLSALVFIPSFLLAVWHIKRVVRKRYFARIFGALLALNVPWMLMFVTVSKVGNFVSSEKPSYSAAAQDAAVTSDPSSAVTATAPSATSTVFKSHKNPPSVKRSLKTLRESAISMNPLIFLFVIPGLMLIERRARLQLAATIVWLVLLGAVLAPWKPQLELDRMLVVFAIISAIPAAAAIQKVLERGAQRAPLARGAAVLVAGFLLTGAISTSLITRNRTIEQFFFKSSRIDEIAERIKQESRSGRVLFSGFMLHQMDEVHVAPLATMTRVPLIASSPFHNLWRYRQVFPESFISKLEAGGVEEYLDLMNVTAVFAHEPSWQQYFRSRPKLYTEIWNSPPFILFSRDRPAPGYIYSGNGAVLSQDLHGLEVLPMSAELVIKFNFIPSLRASGCHIEPAQVAPEISFIKLSGCAPGRPVHIRAALPWIRLKDELTRILAGESR